MRDKLIKRIKTIYNYSLRCHEFSPDDGLNYWRERVLNILLLATFASGLVAIVPSQVASFQTKNYTLFVTNIITYIIIVFLFFNRSIRLRKKVTILSFLIYIQSMVLLLKLGPSGSGLIWLVACTMVAALFMGLKVTFYSIAFNSLIIVVLAVLVHFANFDIVFFQSYDTITWIAVGMNVILISTITSVPLAFLLNALERTLKSERKLKDEQIIYSKQLEIEKKKALESDMLKSAFLANLSHDIRTPMNAIMGFSELIQMETLDNPLTTKYTNQVLQNSNYLQNLISDIVDISLIESKQIKFDYQFIDLDIIISELQEMITVLPIMSKRSNLKISFGVEQKLRNKMLFLDKTHLKQVLINLITNAIKYTPEGNIVISIQEQNHRLALSVQDNGVGIPKSQQHKIFERFLKIERNGEYKMPGIGLGLSISKALVESMNGSIWFESEEKKGTTFHISLPIIEEEVLS